MTAATSVHSHAPTRRRRPVRAHSRSRPMHVPVHRHGRDMMKVRHLDKCQTGRMGFCMFHYTYLFKEQVFRKATTYSKRGWPGISEHAQRWAREGWLELRNPVRVHVIHKHFSWLERYKGPHPPVISQMWEDIAEGSPSIQRRKTEDIEALLSSRWYSVYRWGIMRWERFRGWAASMGGLNWLIRGFRLIR